MAGLQSVWANHQELGPFCADARLYTEEFLFYPAGNTRGQAGWSKSIAFDGLEHLSEFLLKNYKPQQIDRLAIVAHGDQPGVVKLWGKRDRRALTADNFQDYRFDLKLIEERLTQNANVIFMACIAGQGDTGAKLLKGISSILRGRTISGFTTVGYLGPGGATSRVGEKCMEPGVRETGWRSWPSGRNPDELGARWRDLKAMPWSSELSKHAKSARDGIITKHSIDEPPPELVAPQPPASPAPR